jgi:pimeloyl-ACP methyl ester carboxylesterase
MSCVIRLIVLLLLPLSLGCAASEPVQPGHDVIFVVPGVGGDTPGYADFCQGLREGGVTRSIVTVPWGVPTALFMMNFSDPGIHADAEQMLADKILAARSNNPSVRVDLIGHSAGGGVVAGALKRLPANVHVNTVLLLAPSFSPQYDLVPALAHVDGLAHLFYSNRDDFFLDWRTSNFGTYENLKSRAAGNAGMPLKHPKLIQHPYDPSWDMLGNDGGHYGPTAPDFAARVLAPLLRESSNPATTRNDAG